MVGLVLPTPASPLPTLSICPVNVPIRNRTASAIAARIHQRLRKGQRPQPQRIAAMASHTIRVAPTHLIAVAKHQPKRLGAWQQWQRSTFARVRGSSAATLGW